MGSNKITFASAMKELEEINYWFETNELDLDVALTKYERAAKLIIFCQDKLKVTKNKFSEINNRISMNANSQDDEKELEIS